MIITRKHDAAAVRVSDMTPGSWYMQDGSLYLVLWPRDGMARSVHIDTGSDQFVEDDDTGFPVEVTEIIIR